MKKKNTLSIPFSTNFLKLPDINKSKSQYFAFFVRLQVAESARHPQRRNGHLRMYHMVVLDHLPPFAMFQSIPASHGAFSLALPPILAITRNQISDLARPVYFCTEAKEDSTISGEGSSPQELLLY